MRSQLALLGVMVLFTAGGLLILSGSRWGFRRAARLSASAASPAVAGEERR